MIITTQIQDLINNIMLVKTIANYAQRFGENEAARALAGQFSLKNNEILQLDSNYEVDWDTTFKNNSPTTILYFYSLHYVGSLLLEFKESGQREYFSKAEKIVESFFSYIESTENREKVENNRGGGSRDHGTSMRVNLFFQLLQLLIKEKSNPILQKKLAGYIVESAYWFEVDKNYSYNNHGIMVDVSLAQIGLAIGENTPLGTRFIKKADTRLTKLIQLSFDSMGFNNENTIGYHRYNLIKYNEARNLFKSWEIKESSFLEVAEKIIAKAEEALAYCVWQNGTIPPIGDWPVHAINYKSINSSRLFKESGFAVIKSDNLYVSIICGHRGEAHKHVDDTSITIRYYDHDIIIDAGNFNLDKNNLTRQCVASSWGHSGIFVNEIEGMMSAEYLKLAPQAEFTKWHEDETQLLAEVQLTLPSLALTIARQINVIWPNKIIISDQIRHDNADTEVMARQAWLIGKAISRQINVSNLASLQFENEAVSAKIKFHQHGADDQITLHQAAHVPIMRGWASEKDGEVDPIVELSQLKKGKNLQFQTEILLSLKWNKAWEDKTGDTMLSAHEIIQLLNDEAIINKLLETTLHYIAEDFSASQSFSKKEDDLFVTNLPILGTPIYFSAKSGANFSTEFANDQIANTMWFYSLAWIGELLSRFQKTADTLLLDLADTILRSFFDYIAISENREKVYNIRSRDHALSIRTRVFTKYLHISKLQKRIRVDICSKIFTELALAAEWFAQEKNYSRSNHGVMTSMAMAHIGVQYSCFGAFSQQCLQLAAARIAMQANLSFDKKGLCNENTISYHQYNLFLYKDFILFCKEYNIKGAEAASLEAIIEKAHTALQICVYQDGSIPPIGDSSLYSTPTKSINQSECYQESGFAIIKNDDLYVSLICGWRSHHHKHTDDSSITIRYKNKNLIIDGGNYCHDANNKYRKSVASQQGHSGIFLEQGENLLRGDFENQCKRIEAGIDSFEENALGVTVKCHYSILNAAFRVERELSVIWPNVITIRDYVTAQSQDAEATARQRFLIGPTVNVSKVSEDIFCLHAGTFNASLVHANHSQLEVYRGEEDPVVRGWCSEKSGEILPTYGLDFIQTGKNLHFLTTITIADEK